MKLKWRNPIREIVPVSKYPPPAAADPAGQIGAPVHFGAIAKSALSAPTDFGAIAKRALGAPKSVGAIAFTTYNYHISQASPSLCTPIPWDKCNHSSWRLTDSLRAQLCTLSTNVRVCWKYHPQGRVEKRLSITPINFDASRLLKSCSCQQCGIGLNCKWYPEQVRPLNLKKSNYIDFHWSWSLLKLIYRLQSISPDYSSVSFQST